MTIPQQSPVATNTDRADKYENPLRRYASYSYHFILVAIDSTDILTYGVPGTPTAAGNSSLGQAGTPTDGQQAVGINTLDFYERPPGPDPRAVKQTPVGNYSIVIDTRYDTDFFIQDVEWGTAFIGNAAEPGSSLGMNTYVNDGMMTIIEPRGVKFLNTLAEIAGNKYLGIDPNSMPFLLKIIFVGHNDDGTTETIQEVVSNTPPYGILIVNIDGHIDATGSTYKLSFCGCDNGAGWTSVYNSIVEKMKFNIAGGNHNTGTFAYAPPNAQTPSNVRNYGAAAEAVEGKPPKTLADYLAYFTYQINRKYQSDRADIIKNYKDAGIDLSKTANLEWNIVLE